MQLPPEGSLHRGAALIEKEFSPGRFEAIWTEIEPRLYHRLLMPWHLAMVLLRAFFTRVSGLREIVRRERGILATRSIGTLSQALSSPRFSAFLRRLSEELEERSPWDHLRERSLIAVDTTWLSLPATQRTRGLRKVSGDAVGLGAMIALCLNSEGPLLYPLRLLAVMNGAQNDTKPVRMAKLLARGPTYLLDRGFYSMQTVAHWLREGIHFIVRAKEGSLCYEVKRTNEIPKRRLTKGLFLMEDSLVLLGSPKSRAPRSIVRLIRAVRLCDKEQIVLLTDHMDWTAEEVLAAYKRRFEIEDFFLFLKEELGLAHLYGLSASAIEALLRLTLLGTGLLLMLDEATGRGRLIACGQSLPEKPAARLRRALKLMRRMLGVPPPWKPNTTRRPHAKKRKSQKQPRKPPNH